MNAFRVVVPVLTLSLCMLVATAEAAEPGSATGSGLAPQEVDSLVADLRDPEARERLIARLEALRKADETPTAPELDPEELMAAGEDLIDDLVTRARSVEPAWVLRSAALTLGMLILAWLLRWLARLLLLRAGRVLGARIRAAGRAPETAGTDSEAARDMMRLPLRLLDLGLVTGVLLLGLTIWDLPLLSWLNAVAGGALVPRLVMILSVAMVTGIAWNVADALIDRALYLHMGRLQHARSRNRVNTVGPLLRGVSRFVIVTLGLLTGLSALGIDVAPLIASAGILGLAVGFGAQSLIKDLLVGATLVFEDAASIDDWVEVGPLAGTVEQMGLRTMRLRDLTGTLHVLPYSEVTSLSNYTKDYAFAWVDVTVGYEADLGEVLRELEEIGRSIREDEGFRDRVLDDPHVYGVNAFAPSGPLISVRMKTAPVERWNVSREYRRRIKERFQQLGVEIPVPRSRVRLDCGEVPTEQDSIEQPAR